MRRGASHQVHRGASVDSSADCLSGGQDKPKQQAYATFLTKVRQLYDTPYSKFFLECTSHTCLVLLFCYVSLGDFRGRPPWYMWLLVVWMFALTMAEISEVHASGLREWLRSNWNLLDFWIFCLYWGGESLRMISAVEQTSRFIVASKMMYALCAGSLIIRTFRFFVLSQRAGPLLIMVVRMTPDILTFMSLLVVVMMSAGVAIEVLLRPFKEQGDGNVDAMTFQRIFFRPAFQLFGEIFVDDIMEDSNCLGDGTFQGCTYHQLIPIITLMYLFVANIVLVNMLIAMMSQTFVTVQAQSLNIWHMQRYDLLKEFKEKPRLPAPFSILIKFYILLNSGFHSLCNNAVGPEEDADSIKPGSNQLERKLENFQERHTERYLEKARQNREGEDKVLNRMMNFEVTMTSQLIDMNSKINRLESRFGKLLTSNFRRLQNVVRDMGRDVKSDYKKLSNNITVSNRGSCATTPDTFGDLTFVDETKDDIWTRATRAATKEKAKEDTSVRYVPAPDRHTIWDGGNNEWDFQTAKVGTHILKFRHKPNSRLDVDDPNRFKPREEYNPHDQRNLLVIWPVEESWIPQHKSEKLKGSYTAYGQPVFRHHLTENERDWDHPLVDYNPLDFTSPYVLYFSKDSPIQNIVKWADASVRPSLKEQKVITITAGRSGSWPDVKVSEDTETAGRESCNPLGRTGLRGRGTLGKWGPNRCVIHVITREKCDSEERRMERGGKVMQELLLFKRKEGQWELPGEFSSQPKAVDGRLRNIFGVSGKGAKGQHEEDVDITAELLETEQILLDADRNADLERVQETGDQRDTDEAWVSFDVRYVDLFGTMLKESRVKFKIAEHEDTDYMFEWVTIHRDLIMRWTSHKEIVNALVDMKSSFW